MSPSEGQHILHVPDKDGLAGYGGGPVEILFRKTLLRLEVLDSRARGRPKRRFMNVVKEDVKFVAIRGDDGEDRVGWRKMIGYGHHGGQTAKELCFIFLTQQG